MLFVDEELPGLVVGDGFPVIDGLPVSLGVIMGVLLWRIGASVSGIST